MFGEFVIWSKGLHGGSIGLEPYQTLSTIILPRNRDQLSDDVTITPGVVTIFYLVYGPGSIVRLIILSGLHSTLQPFPCRIDLTIKSTNSLYSLHLIDIPVTLFFVFFESLSLTVVLSVSGRKHLCFYKSRRHRRPISFEYRSLSRVSSLISSRVWVPFV